MKRKNRVFPRLSWSTNGLSADAQPCFGVHDYGVRNPTCIGVSPLASGALLLVR